MSKTIKISVRDKIAVNMSNIPYTCGNSDFVINFDFDEEWDEFSVKTARFIKDDRTYQNQVFQGNECPVPVIYNTNKIRVGVFAGNLHTSTPAIVKANKGILCGDGSPEAPSDDVYAQIMEMLNNSGSVAPAVKLDTTLTVAGRAADAKAVGDALANAGTKKYTELNGKPSINGVELTGNKTSADLGIGNPTDEQVAENVRAWLDEHPEATTTVADGSISTEKLADGAVSVQKTGFLAFAGLGENLFNKATTTDKKVIYNGGKYNELLDNDTICVSDFIPVEANEVYCRSANSFESTGTVTTYQPTFFYDAEKNGLSSLRHCYKDRSFTTPENCAYIRINLPMDCKDIAMVCKGNTEPNEYVSYREYYKLGDAITIGVDNIESLSAIFEAMPNGSITKAKLADEVTDEIESVDSRIKTAAGWYNVQQPTKKLTGRINVFEHTVKGLFDIASDISDKTIVVHGVNYFDKNDLIPGKLDNSSGNISDSATDYYTKHLIPVQPGKRLMWNRNSSADAYSYILVFEYGANQQFLRRNTTSPSGGSKAGSFITGDDTYFIRFEFENLVDTDEEKFCVADVDIGSTVYSGYDGNFPIVGGGDGKTYFGRNVYFPYVGYRIENGVLIGAADTYTVEEITHVDVFEADSTIEVTAPVEAFDRERLHNVVLKYGRYGDTDYVMARIFKSTITGGTISPRVLAFTPGGKTMNDLAKENDFVMAINAGVFNTDDNSCIGVVISDGVVVTDHVDHYYSGSGDVLCIDSSGNLASYAYETTTADMLAAGVTGAVSGKNTLIQNYAKYDLDLAGELLGDTTLCTSKHPRTAIGQYKNGDYMVFTCGGRETNQAGMTCAEMQEIFVAEGLKYAYNLDGGGSCSMRFFKKAVEPYTENRKDPTYIVFD